MKTKEVPITIAQMAGLILFCIYSWCVIVVCYIIDPEGTKRELDRIL